MKRLIGLNVAAALATALSVTAAEARTRLSGSGATFPSPFYTRTFSDYYKQTKNQVNYQATGSGSGVRQFFASTIDFGATDKAVKDNYKLLDKRKVVQIPVVGGAIVPAYNKPGCDLKLKQKQLADIYLGKIINWSELGCEAGKISPVFRSDGSGTTAAFTNSLSAFSPEWKSKVGTAKAVQWPVGVGSKGNAGVAASIKQTLNSIGYVNQSYIRGTVVEATIENKAGKFVKATAETSGAGLSKIVLDDKLRGTNPNPAGENSYPIVSLTWILAEPGYKSEEIKSMLRYMLSEKAQTKADSLGYISLPSELKQKALEAIESL